MSEHPELRLENSKFDSESRSENSELRLENSEFDAELRDGLVSELILERGDNRLCRRKGSVR